jgi:predicted branched-subunit amino acid permease
VIRAVCSAAFWRGLRASVPLWFVAIPFATTYALAARDAGLSGAQIQFMSLSLNSAVTQTALAQLFGTGALLPTVLMTILLMNIHSMLYGAALSRQIAFSRMESAIAAFGLTDAAYGMTTSHPSNTNLPFLLGIEIGMFLSWNVCTAIAILFTPLFSDLAHFQLDFIAPLTFFLLLLSLIKTRTSSVVAIFSGAAACFGAVVGFGSITIFAVGILGSLFGFGLENSPRLRRCIGEK